MILAVLVLAGESRAQDTHYWTHQYGTRSTLLGGAVIGSVVDVSATYYNPGALALIEDPELFLGTKIFDFTTVTVDNSLEEGTKLNSDDLKQAPSFFGGLLPFGFLGEHRVGYSFFTRQQFSVRVEGARVGTFDAIPRWPGLESFVGAALFDESLSETWFGLTWSHTLGRRAGIGISQYVAVRSQRGNFRLSGQALTANGDAAITLRASEYKYTNYRTLWKVGLSYDLDRLTFGLTVTTPSLNLFGSGSSGVNTTRFGQDIEDDGQTETLLAADFQEDVSSRYASPVSIAAGATVQFGSRALHVSAEWFDKVSPFDVLALDDFQGQSSGEVLPHQLMHTLDAVLNVAVGIEQSFGERVSGYASFATDFSGFVPEAGTDVGISDWNLYHITGGTSFRVGRAAFTLGLGYAYGGETTRRQLSFVGASEANALLGEPTETELTYRRWKFIIGFELDTRER